MYVAFNATLCYNKIVKKTRAARSPGKEERMKAIEMIQMIYSIQSPLQ